MGVCAETLESMQAIKGLRRSLKEAGAQTFTHNAPWPGCVNVLVFPEQMVDQVTALQSTFKGWWNPQHSKVCVSVQFICSPGGNASVLTLPVEL